MGEKFSLKDALYGYWLLKPMRDNARAEARARDKALRDEAEAERVEAQARTEAARVEAENARARAAANRAIAAAEVAARWAAMSPEERTAHRRKQQARAIAAITVLVFVTVPWLIVIHLSSDKGSAPETAPEAVVEPVPPPSAALASPLSAVPAPPAGDQITTPTPPSDSPFLQPVDEYWKLTDNSGIYEAPNTESKVLGLVHIGHGIHVIGIVPHFLKIVTKKGVVGYIPANLAEDQDSWRDSSE